MKYQKVINVLDTTTNQLAKFRAKTWVEITDNSNETFAADKEIKFKSSMLRPSLCNYLSKELEQLQLQMWTI